MERISDDRRNLIIHGNAVIDDLPMTGLDELPPIADDEGFVPANVDEPMLYPGDVLVGMNDGLFSFAELIYDKVEDGVLVFEIDTGHYQLMDDQKFGARFYQTDEIHVYDDLTRKLPESDVEFQPSEVERPETGRAR
jgi:hypothetical protein